MITLHLLKIALVKSMSPSRVPGQVPHLGLCRVQALSTKYVNLTVQHPANSRNCFVLCAGLPATVMHSFVIIATSALTVTRFNCMHRINPQPRGPIRPMQDTARRLHALLPSECYSRIMAVFKPSASNSTLMLQLILFAGKASYHYCDDGS